MTRPVVGRCKIFTRLDGVVVLWAVGVGEISDYRFVYSDGVGVLSCKLVGPCEFVAGSDGVKMRWAKGVKEMSDRYLF